MMMIVILSPKRVTFWNAVFMSEY